MYKSEKQLEGGINYNQPIHFQLVYQVLPALKQASTYSITEITIVAE